MARSFLFPLLLAVCVCTACFAVPAFADSQKEYGDISTRKTSTGARLVFKWNAGLKVPFRSEAHGDKVTLHFDSPVNLQWSQAMDDLKPYLKEIETQDDSKTVVITLSNPSQAKKFLVNGKNGIDFSKNGLELIGSRNNGKSVIPVSTMSAEKETDDEEAPAPKKVKTAKLSKKETKAKKQLAANKAKAKAKKPPVDESDTAYATDLAKLSPAAGEPAAAISVPAAPTVAPAQPAPVASSVVTPTTPAATVTAPVVTAPVTTAPVVTTPAPPPVATQAAAPADAGLPAVSLPSMAASPAPAAVQTATKPVEQAEVISLPLLADDSFAVFVKDKTLWIAADEEAKMTEQSLKNENKSLAYPTATVPAKAGSVITLALNKSVNVAVVKLPDGKMQVELSAAEQHPAQPLEPTLSTQDAKTSLAIEATKPGKVIAASDPVTGATLSIVPLPTASSGIGTGRSFVEFSLLPTAQGIVVQQVSDDLNVNVTKKGVDITAPKGLSVSDEMKKQLEEAKDDPESGKAHPVFFPYARWKLDDEKKFVPMQLKLIHASMSDNKADANNARLRMLGLFLAEGMFPEANGMANEILRNSYKFYVDHKVAAMRGAANFFRFRLTEAERDFSSPELEGLPETAMWLALCGELTGKDNGRFDFKANYPNIIKYYPPVFIQKMAIIAADKSIVRKDYDTATDIFGILEKDGIDEPVKKYTDFMRAKILSETGNEEEAAKIWERQSGDVADRFIRSRAEFSLVNMYLKEEKIPVEDAAKRLEKLRIVWRGDGQELNVLTLLGDLYVEEKDYARALRAWRDIVAYYADVPEAITTARKMEEVFVKLYNKGGADDMPPLSALSLFYEFRDLVPTGSEGDVMIRNLAERLVKIDLLDRASQLLSHQIHNRLAGTERSRVGARLAEIYLMNRQPKEALETLKTTGYGDLSPDLQLQRIRLTAEALAQQGQLAKAIDVLSGDTSADGNLLRLTVYWTNRDWTNVVATAEEILSNRNDPSAPLTLPESEVLMKLATAYVYEHDSGQIQYLRDYFTPLLKNNPNRASFLFITSESGSIDYSNLSNLDTDINTVKSFIDTSRKQAAKSAAPLASDTQPVKKAVN